MTPATRTHYDICVDGQYWHLTMLAEWQHFHGLDAQAGVVWRHADATRHRLLGYPLERQRTPRPVEPTQLPLFAEGA